MNEVVFQQLFNEYNASLICQPRLLLGQDGVFQLEICTAENKTQITRGGATYLQDGGQCEI
jgi:hypothetical protein